MKQVSTNYKNQIKELGREIDSIITYYNHYQVITENNKFILTEDGQKILTEQIKDDSSVNITAEDIYSCKVITHGDLLKTMMKEFDFEVKQDIKVGSIVSYKFGLKVNNSIEYVDYGMFIVNQKEYNEDRQTYSYVAYDKMLFTMIPYVAEDISERIGTYTLYDLVNYCCEFNDLQLGVASFPNGEREITSSTLKLLEESNFTFRDVLDYATEVTGCSSYILDEQFVIMPPQETLTDNLFDINKANNYVPVNTANTLYEIYENGYLSALPTTMDWYSNIPPMSTNPSQSQINLVKALAVEVKSGATYTFSYKNPNRCITESLIFEYDADGKYIKNTAGNVRTDSDIFIRKLITTSTTKYVMFRFDNESYNSGPKQLNIQDIMFLLGDYSLSNLPRYEDYGLYTLYEDSFKDTNVKFNEVFGPINSILFSRSEDTDIIEIKDEDSIALNGVTQIKIKDNPFLEGNDRSDYFEEMFDVLNGLTYSLNDYSSPGITYLEFNDKYRVNIDNNEYTCLMLNDEINVIQGLEENVFTEAPNEKQEKYITSRLDDRGQKWANIQVKKDLGEISIEVGKKVDNDNVISAINLSPEQATIQAQKVNLQGYVTATDLAGTGTTTINGSNITTGTINASLIKAGQITMSGYTSGNPFINLGDLTDDTYPYGIQIWDNCIHLIDYRDGGLSYIRTENGDGYAELSGAVCRAFDFVPLSLAEKKENFEKLENALDIVKDVDIYKYNFKNEKSKSKKHIGFVIGDKFKYRKEITSSENDGANLYAMISVLWKAVQEQQKEIEELKERIDK